MQLVTAYAADVEQIVHQADHVRELSPENLRGVAKELGIALGPQENLQRMTYRSQRIPQLVGERGQELVLAPVRLPQRRVQLFALGDVSGDFGRADDAARIVANR